tara:strand:- start:319 stop:1392 length:1074 start_codon:yes stop_codon:yes gene_type:complete
MFDKNNKENIHLMIDLHNDMNEDALILIAKYYLKEVDVKKTQIKDISQKEITLMLETSKEEKIKRVEFPEKPKNSIEVSNFFYACLSHARSNAPEGYPLSHLENLIKKTLNLDTYITRVKSKREISSNIIEITFEGGLENLPDLQNDSFMYLIIHNDLNHKYPNEFTMRNFRELNTKDNNPYSGAYYTIRSFRENEIDIWFVLHNNPGPLAVWAEEAVERSEVAMWGPRTSFSPPSDTKSYLFIADETAQPAVLASIENLKDKEKYICLFETQNESTKFEYDDPQNRIEWIFRENIAAGEGTKLLERIEDLSVDPKNLYIFCAGEAKQISIIRKTLKKNLSLNADQMSFTGYWRRTG